MTAPIGGVACTLLDHRLAGRRIVADVRMRADIMKAKTNINARRFGPFRPSSNRRGIFRSGMELKKYGEESNTGELSVTPSPLRFTSSFKLRVSQISRSSGVTGSLPGR